MLSLKNDWWFGGGRFFSIPTQYRVYGIKHTLGNVGYMENNSCIKHTLVCV